MTVLSRRAAVAFGAADLVTAALVVFGVFVGLPARWWPVDGAAALLACVELASAYGLLARSRWAERVARAAGLFALALGLLTISLLAVTASWLSGIYGPVGKGAAVVLALVAALAFPYLVALPAAQLLWLWPQSDAGRAMSGSR